MAEIYLNQIAHGRSGDKGDTSNVCVFARKPEYFRLSSVRSLLKRFVSTSAIW